jgi:hypothetical protein
MPLPTTTQATLEAEQQEEEKVVAPHEGQATQQQEAPEADPEANLLAAEEEAEAIPEKYVGKSPLEIIKMHREAERVIGRLGSEKSFKEREAEELRQRVAAYEAQMRSQSQPAQRQSVAPVEESDPLQVLNKKWEENPKEAIEKAFETIEHRSRRIETQRILESNQKALVAKYQDLSKNEDFKELEPEMEQIVKGFAGHLHPHQINTPETLEAVYLMAKGKNIGKLVQSEATKQAKKQQLVRAEKKAAFSESGASRGESTRKFEELSRDEMRNLLAVSDKY